MPPMDSLVYGAVFVTVRSFCAITSVCVATLMAVAWAIKVMTRWPHIFVSTVTRRWTENLRAKRTAGCTRKSFCTCAP